MQRRCEPFPERKSHDFPSEHDGCVLIANRVVGPEADPQARIIQGLMTGIGSVVIERQHFPQDSLEGLVRAFAEETFAREDEGRQVLFGATLPRIELLFFQIEQMHRVESSKGLTFRTSRILRRLSSLGSSFPFHSARAGSCRFPPLGPPPPDL